MRERKSSIGVHRIGPSAYLAIRSRKSEVGSGDSSDRGSRPWPVSVDAGAVVVGLRLGSASSRWWLEVRPVGGARATDMPFAGEGSFSRIRRTTSTVVGEASVGPDHEADFRLPSSDFRLRIPPIPGSLERWVLLYMTRLQGTCI